MSKFRGESRRRMLRGLAAVGIAACAVLPAIANAQGPVIRLIVPFPPGGPADAMARVLVDKLKDELKQNVIVDNRPGASTRLAAEVLKNSNPDGNAVLLTLLDTMVIAPMVYANLRYDPDKDFAPITEVAAVNFCIAVSETSPYRSVSDYVKAAKSNQTAASLGVASGLGTVPHFLAFDLAKASRTDLSIVPFQGGGAVVTNLIGNQIGSAIDGLGVFVEQHKAHKLRILAVSGKQRASQLPDVPTFAEQGFPSLTVRSGYALYAPATTPANQIARWNSAMKKVLAMPDVRSRIQDIGYEPVPGGAPADVTELKRRLVDHWGPIVRNSGYTSE